MDVIGSGGDCLVKSHWIRLRLEVCLQELFRQNKHVIQEVGWRNTYNIHFVLLFRQNSSTIWIGILGCFPFNKKSGLKFPKFHGQVGCTDLTQATARLVIVLLSRIQKSGTGGSNFFKWKGTLWSNQLKWPDQSKRTTFKAGPEYRGGPNWNGPFHGVPTKISGILGWIESIRQPWALESRIPLSSRIQNPSSTVKEWNPVLGICKYPWCGDAKSKTVDCLVIYLYTGLPYKKMLYNQYQTTKRIL